MICKYCEFFSFEKECFKGCLNLMNLEFEENSELMLIGRDALNGTKINVKSIPSNVKVEIA